MKIDCEMSREKDRVRGRTGGGGREREKLKKKGGKREQEGKRRRIAENSRPRNPAFSLRRLKINATTHRFPVPLATPLRIVISTRLSFTRVHRSLSLVDLFSVLSRVSTPPATSLRSSSSFPQHGYFRCLGRLSAESS